MAEYEYVDFELWQTSQQNLEVLKSDMSKSILNTVSRGHLAKLRYLVEEQQIDVHEEIGGEYFVLAAQNGHCEIVQYLVDQCQFDTNARNQHGDTALMAMMYAGVVYGMPKVVFSGERCPLEANEIMKDLEKEA